MWWWGGKIYRGQGILANGSGRLGLSRLDAPCQHRARWQQSKDMAKGPPNTIRLGRVLGIDIYLDYLWILVPIYFFSFGEARYSSPVWNVWVCLALFAIVLLHEFGHALACRQVGGRADTIKLGPLGGVAYVDPPQRPGAVLWCIAAGPLVNVALLFVFTLITGPFPNVSELFLSNEGRLLGEVWWINFRTAGLQSPADLSAGWRSNPARIALVCPGTGTKPFCGGNYRLRGRRWPRVPGRYKEGFVARLHHLLCLPTLQPRAWRRPRRCVNLKNCHAGRNSPAPRAARTRRSAQSGNVTSARPRSTPLKPRRNVRTATNSFPKRSVWTAGGRFRFRPGAAVEKTGWLARRRSNTARLVPPTWERGNQEKARLSGAISDDGAVKKIFRLLLVPAILYLGVMARSASAEWYEITVEHGLTTETFVGFTSMSTEAMALALSDSKPIVLENLRVYQARDGTANRMQWWPDRDGKKLFLRPEKIVYFYLLPEDPAAK